jgi:Tfp pilus assembly protein PilO
MEELLERYNSLSQSVKLAALAVCSLLAAYYSYDSSVVAANTEQAGALEEQTKLEEELSSISSAGQSIVALEAELKKADDEINSLVELLPPEPEVEKLLGLFSAAAKNSGVHLSEYVLESGDKDKNKPPAAAPPLPTPTPASGAPVTLPINPIEVKSAPNAMDDMSDRVRIDTVIIGSYPKIVSFLDKVTSFTRVIRVASVNFNLNTIMEDIGPSAPPSIVTPTSNLNIGTIPLLNPSSIIPEPAMLKKEIHMVEAKVSFFVYSQKINKNPGADALTMSSIAPVDPKQVPASVPPENSGANPAEAGALSAKPLSSPSGEK